MIRSKIATRFGRVKRMAFFWALVALALHVIPGAVNPTRAQGSRKDDIVFNSRGVPLAGATVRVCAMPASGQPCSPLALIYSDSALTQALANPTTTDGLGNYFFYAAPGKYEIEISGPGITTKQIPNIILPSDPSSPTFSSVSTTGGISAFSLNLSGNLTVNGNTTVLGNLASGTLNLSNQSTPPGTASTGTVNLYTKTADKRLYYKDDTGTEIGPIANTSGAQTNVSNTFTAAQNIDADFHVKGPNPSFDLSRYGGYIGANPPPATTCTITSGSTTATCASAIDFQNGHGLVIYGAGATTTLTAPQTPTVTPGGILNGTTTYSYTLIAEDRAGGLTASPTAGTTTVGAATLGANTVNLTQAVRFSGTTTYTTATAHNFQAGQTVLLCGFGGGSGCPGTFFNDFNGTKVIVSTPTSTTFTVGDANLPDRTDTTGAPSAEVQACNTLTFPASSYSGNATLRYWIYRKIGTGSYSIAGAALGLDPFFIDCGQGISGVPSYVPSTPPASAQAGYLVSTIASGGGTTTLTLANAAGTSVTNATTLHDNGPNLKAASQAAGNLGGGTIYIPSNTSGGQAWTFNSFIDFTTLTGLFQSCIHILNNGVIVQNQPWLPAIGMDFEGMPRQWNTFNYIQGAVWMGSANPFFLLQVGSRQIHFNRMIVENLQAGQTAFFADDDTNGEGSTGNVWDNVAVYGHISRPYILKGGFDWYFNGGNCGATDVSLFPTACYEFTNSSTAVVGAGNPSQIPGRVRFKGVYFETSAIVVDNLPNSLSGGGFDFEFQDGLIESQTVPYLRVNMVNNAYTSFYVFHGVIGSDEASGLGTPFIDVSNSSNFQSLSWFDGFLPGSGSQPLLGGGSSVTSIFASHAPTPYIASSVVSYYSAGTASTQLANGNVFSAFNNARLMYQMSNPALPLVAVSAGGGVPLGGNLYQITAVDGDGKETLISTGVTATTTSGNQTVTVTPPTLPTGAVGYKPYRNGALVALPNAGFGSCGSGFVPVGTNFVDVFGFTCGTSPPGISSAGSSFLSQNGIGTYKLNVAGEAITASPRAEQNVFLPGALTSAWTGATWTTDKAVTVTRVQVQAKTAPSGCTTNAVVRLTDGSTPVNVTISGVANDSGAISQAYAAGASLTISVQTAASGCTTSPADANVVVQYKMQ